MTDVGSAWVTINPNLQPLADEPDEDDGERVTVHLDFDAEEE